MVVRSRWLLMRQMTAVQETLLSDVESSPEALGTITRALEGLHHLISAEPAVLHGYHDQALGVLHSVWELREKKRVKDVSIGASCVPQCHLGEVRSSVIGCSCA